MTPTIDQIRRRKPFVSLGRAFSIGRAVIDASYAPDPVGPR